MPRSLLCTAADHEALGNQGGVQAGLQEQISDGEFFVHTASG